MYRVRRTNQTAQHRRVVARAGRGGSVGTLRKLMALLLLIPMVVLVTATSAGAVLVAGFEIDGDKPVNGGGVDWATTGVTTTDPVGGLDESNFTGGSKEFQNPSLWEEGPGTSTPQGDISDVYSHISNGAESWAFMGFQRTKETGTMTFMVEFNQKANSAPQPGDSVRFRPNRTVNDLLLRFEQDGNDSFELTAAYKWAQSAGGSFPNDCFTVAGYATPSAYCPTDLNGSGFAGATSADGLFAEGAVNLSAFDDAGDCRGAFGVMNVRSFAGDSETSSLLDFIGGIGINVPPTCGSLIIDKRDQFQKAVPGATFRVTPDPRPGSNAAFLEVTDGDAAEGDFDGVANGTVTISPAKPGSYTVVEIAAPDGYILDTSVKTDVVVGSSGTSVATVSFTNKLTFRPPTIGNVATATYDVDHNWVVRKSVDRTHADIPAGGSAPFEYTVRLEAKDKVISGRELGGTVTIANPNAQAMVGTLSSEVVGGAACTFPGVADASGAAGLQVSLAPGSHSFVYTCVPAPGADGSTRATLTWDAATYPQADPAATYTRTGVAAYAYAVDQNADQSTTVKDVFAGGGAEDLGTFDWDTVWAAANHTVVVKTYTRRIPGVPGTCTDYPNKATESADGTEATQSVEVCVGAALDVTKDAHLGFQRELLWDIAKSGPGTVWVGENSAGDLETSVDFTIDVTADGMTDSAWDLTGTIHIDNPNEWPVAVDVTDTVVVDTKVLTCAIDGGSRVVVPARAVDHAVTYDCPGVEQGDYVGKNTVTIDWSKDSHAYPRTNDSDTVDVEVEGDSEPTNATVTLKDLLDGTDVTARLPQSTFDWATVNAEPGHTQSLTYSVVLGTGAGACTTYTNVVTIRQTQQSDDARAIICSPGVVKDFEADYGRKQLWTVDKVVDRTTVDIAAGGSHTFTYTVTATPGAVVDDGSASWSGTVTVSNPSATESLTVDVTDVPDVTGWTCSFDDDSTGVRIAAGQSAVLDYTCQPARGAGHPDGTNTAVVGFGQGQSVSDQVDVAFTARDGVADSVVAVHDDMTDPDSPPVELGEADAGDEDTWEFTYSVVKTGAAGECTTYTNTAFIDLAASANVKDSAQARLCVVEPIKVDVEGSGTYGVTYPWTIDKVLDGARTVEVDAATGEAVFDYQVVVRAGAERPAGWALSGTVTVVNPNGAGIGAITLTDVDVTTDVRGGAACTAAPPAAPVASGDDVTIPFTCTFTGQPDTSGTVTADVRWDPAGEVPAATTSDTSGVALTVGDGQEIDKVIQVWDDKTDPENPVLLDESLEWSEGLVETYEYSLTHEGVPGRCVDFTNTAWLDLDGSQDPEDSTTATVCVEQPLQPRVSGRADLARAYAWSVAKVADATQRTVDASGTATFTYTVTAKAGAATDSGWKLDGSVQVVNPNQYAAGDVVADVTASTDLGGGSTCTVTGGQDVQIPASVDGAGSVTLPIVCTFSSQPSGSGALGVDGDLGPRGWGDDEHGHRLHADHLRGPLGDQQDRPGRRRPDGGRPAGRARPVPDLGAGAGADLHLLAGGGRRRCRCLPEPHQHRDDRPAGGCGPDGDRRRPGLHPGGAAGAGLRQGGRVGEGELPGHRARQAGQPVRREGDLHAPRGQEGAEDRRQVPHGEEGRHARPRLRQGDPQDRPGPARPAADPGVVRRPGGPARHGPAGHERLSAAAPCREGAAATARLVLAGCGRYVEPHHVVGVTHADDHAASRRRPAIPRPPLADEGDCVARIFRFRPRPRGGLRTVAVRRWPRPRPAADARG